MVDCWHFSTFCRILVRTGKSSATMLTVVLFVCFILWYSLSRLSEIRRANPDGLPYPPGPPSKWFIGNLLDMPTSVNFNALKSWREKHGDMTFMRAFGQSILILNTLKAATELLDRRGVAYAHRPPLVMAGELMGVDQGMALMDYGSRQKQGRRLAHQALGPEAIKTYEPALERISTLLLQMLIARPADFESSIRLTVGRIILNVSYGLPLTTVDTEYIDEAERVMTLVEEATAPGAYFVEYFPIMKHIPSWFPFANFKRFAEEGRRQVDAFVNRPFQAVKEEMKRGSARASLVSGLLSDRSSLVKGSESEEDVEYIIMWVAATLYGAGTATSNSTMLTFIMLMAMHPEIQRKAQGEIDSVTEGQRLPTAADREHLPYVAAILKEVTRWHAVVPLGLARHTRKPDTYNGYFIPANTMVLANLWAMGKTEGTSLSPQAFIPERHLDGAETIDPYSYVFGFGRRICPGRYLADTTLFLMMASVLACFNISKKLSKSANGDDQVFEVPIIPNFTTHLISYPERFPCDIQPRSPDIIDLVENSVALSSGVV